MTRGWLLSSGPIDHDALAHRDALARVVTLTRNQTVEGSLPLILAESAKLIRHRREIDVVVTLGEAALRAARLGWGGPMVHLCLGLPSRAEVALARSMAKRRDFRFVTSSLSLARLAQTYIADPHQIRVIRPIPSLALPSRVAVRSQLNLADDARLLYVPGVARYGNDHKLALWAAGILVVREPDRVRVVVDGGGQDDRIRRLIGSRAQAHAMFIDESLRAIDYAAAADVAVIVGEQSPGFAPLAALAAAGTPIVASAAVWRRERLDLPARLIDKLKPRRVARAILDAFDAPRRDAVAFDANTTVRAWADVVTSVSTRRPNRFPLPLGEGDKNSHPEKQPRPRKPLP